MNDTEREQWVNNDEGLYLWWRRSHKSLRAFVRENRADIDAAIGAVPQETLCNELTRRKPRRR